MVLKTTYPGIYLNKKTVALSLNFVRYHVANNDVEEGKIYTKDNFKTYSLITW